MTTLALLPFAAAFPPLSPLTPAQRAIAERLTRLLDDEVTARRDQIDMVARLSAGSDRLSTRGGIDPHRRAVCDITEAAYRGMIALDAALLNALDPDETLDLARTHDTLDQDGMTDAALARLSEIREPRRHDDSLVSDHDFARRVAP